MSKGTVNPLAKGFYTVAEASRLIRVGSANRIYGWLRGYPRRQIGPLLSRDYEPIGDTEELSFLDLMEVRFVEHFREHGVKVKSLRIAAETLRHEFSTDHPFAMKKVVIVADKADVFVADVFRNTAKKTNDLKLRSLVTKNYVMYEAIKQSLIPGVVFDDASHLAARWAPVPEIFPNIYLDPKIAYGQPAGRSGVSTSTIYEAWKAEHEDIDAVSYWHEIPTTEVLEAVRFEQTLTQRLLARAA